jgi:K(+)-stimulated pyrophosphate-energized sodium pump
MSNKMRMVKEERTLRKALAGLLVVLVLLGLCMAVGFGETGTAAEASGSDKAVESESSPGFWVWLLWGVAPVGSAIALVFAWRFSKWLMQKEEGTKEMIAVAQYVREGARAYIRRQYRTVSMFFLFAFAFLFFLAWVLHVQHKLVPFAFLTGGFFSGLCGYLGMKTATNASARTANAARDSLNSGLQVAFRSGAVMGLIVVGLGLLDICGWFVILQASGVPLRETTVIMLCFGMGASSQALFARVGGGIFTKAADVGADLVGKVEAGIPEDDPRNPATIADNVGDNVGDVAGMGADLYESYCGAILATAALGAAAGLGFKSVIAPMVMAGIGIMLSVVGIFAVRAREDATQKNLIAALGRGINLSALGILVLGFALLMGIFGWKPGVGIWAAVATGLVVGIIIGKASEYFTSGDYKPTQGVAEQSQTGPATVIIAGISTGMLSTGVPVLAIGLGTILSFAFAGGFTDAARGLYGIGIAAVGMLSTLGITLATDAYGPIADNAGGNAEMSGLEPEVRRRTDALDALGNTTAATGKGFAIGSAALTALALLAAYIEEVRIGLVRIGTVTMQVGDDVVRVAGASLADFMTYYNVTLMNPKVLVGLFLGSALAFVFCALTMKAVGRAAGKMVNEVRRQFKEMPGIMSGEQKPDYAACVSISTIAAQKEMVLPSLMALIFPIVVGLLLGVGGVMGLLAGGLASGFVLAVFMANAGGSWDNAKKSIEGGLFGGKGSDAHKASVVGDTVGDPFKDTSGPSLNILIKLMSMVSVVVAGLVAKYAPQIQEFLGIAD